MPHRTPKTSAASGSGLLLGALALLGGASWYLKHRSDERALSRRQRLPAPGSTGPSSTSLSPSWLLGGLGAGVAGAVVGASGLKQRHRTDARKRPGDVHLSGHVTIHRSPEEVYQFWRNFQNLPSVMSFIERVEPMEGNVTHWVAKVPAGQAIQWDAETVDDQPGRRLAWRSLEGSDLQTWGTVIFERSENNLSTDVSVSFNFSPPANGGGSVSQYIQGLENAILNRNLRELKARLEAGENPS
ncbi:SRPBCC family protein [Marinobacter sp.]|uniref:SRPBCC family protein n=1 Tax=Marinobacter sp. TaxID=50741 RepID=UPI0035636CE0